jgi:hypothetical protein
MKTELVIKNCSKQDVTVWITLGATPGCLQNVAKIPYVMNVLSALVGNFVLKAGKSTLAYAPDGGLGFNANLSFDTQPQNCPTVACPNGVNIFEFILNNQFQSGSPQETVDISCVAGVNCRIMAELGGDEWNAGPTVPRIKRIENGPIGTNTGRIGVYPVGCDTCISSTNPPFCSNPPAYETPQAEAICNVQRPASHHGGIVEVEYLGKL